MKNKVKPIFGIFYSRILLIIRVITENRKMSFFDDVYSEVRKIPEGKVSTYGNIAKACGCPRASRIVGGALHRNPYFGEVPCHRVVFADGSLAKAFVFGGEDVQRQMLENEGVTFLDDGKVDMKKHLV